MSAVPAAVKSFDRRLRFKGYEILTVKWRKYTVKFLERVLQCINYVEDEIKGGLFYDLFFEPRYFGLN